MVVPPRVCVCVNNDIQEVAKSLDVCAREKKKQKKLFGFFRQMRFGRWKN